MTVSADEMLRLRPRERGGRSVDRFDLEITVNNRNTVVDAIEERAQGVAAFQNLRVTFRQLLIGIGQFAEEPRVFDSRSHNHRDRIQQLEIGGGKRSLDFVDRFDDPDHLFLALQWNRNQGSSGKASGGINLGIPTRIVANIWHQSRLSLARDPTCNTLIQTQTQRFGLLGARSQRHFENEFMSLLVQQH